MSFSGLLSELTSLICTRTVAIAAVSIILAVILSKVLLRIRWSLKIKSYPRDVVILHQFPRGYRIPSLSPFVMKLETWLRMTNIKYQNEHGYTFGPKGKIPFITYNGRDVADSQFCIEFLSKTFNKDLSKDHSAKELAAARAFSKMAEESFFWASGLCRFVFEPDPKYIGFHPIIMWFLRRTYMKKTYVQGYGRHSKQEVFSIAKNDLKSLNDFLEGKKYLSGDKPCNEDASVFGIVVQVVYTDNGTLNRFVKEECPNVLTYIENIKNTYWSDWNECINRKEKKKD